MESKVEQIKWNFRYFSIQLQRIEWNFANLSSIFSFIDFYFPIPKSTQQIYRSVVAAVAKTTIDELFLKSWKNIFMANKIDIDLHFHFSPILMRRTE
jgi:hypothetical protein